ncbi:MAG: hypothetical protein AAFU03_00515 [Bacteroidota bacterium]
MQITEQDIRRLAIGHLRLYYKFHPRRDWDGIQVVDKAHFYGGITIDARLTYVEPNGKLFIATVEATSLNKRAELDYRFWWFRLMAESLTLSLLTACSVLGLAQVQGLIPESHAFITAAWWHLPAACGGVWGFWALLLSLNYRRYRYIYAIEQFKRFHADDQWIAFDGTLYPSHTDGRFYELERQCIRYGFGLLEVEKDRTLRVIIAPKRGDFFDAGRQQLPAWVQQLEKAPGIGRLVRAQTNTTPKAKANVDPSMRDPLADFMSEEETPAEQAPAAKSPAKASPPRKANKKGKSAKRSTTLNGRWLHLRWLLRHQLRSFYPKSLRSLPGFFRLAAAWRYTLWGSFFITALLAYRQASYSTIAFPGEAEEAYDLENLEGNPDRPPPVDYEYEARLNEEDIAAIDNRELPDFSLQEELTRLPENTEEALPDPGIAGSDTNVFFYRLAPNGDTTTLYNCLRLPDNGEDYFILEYRRTKTYAAALQAANSLFRRGGLTIGISRADCFRLGAPGYSVFIDDPASDEPDVNFRFRRYTRELGLDLEIITIN